VKTICIGILLTFCQPTGSNAPLVLSDQCRQDARNVQRIESMPAEVKRALPRVQKQINASIIQRYQKHCQAK